MSKFEDALIELFAEIRCADMKVPYFLDIDFDQRRMILGPEFFTPTELVDAFERKWFEKKRIAGAIDHLKMDRGRH